MKTTALLLLILAAGVEAAAAQSAAPADSVYEVSVVEVQPRLRNRAAVGRAIERGYPQHLRAAGIGGTVVLSMLLDERGVPTEVQVESPAASAELNAAAVEVGRGMRFAPAEASVDGKSRPVKVRIRIPIHFRPERVPATGAAAGSR